MAFVPKIITSVKKTKRKIESEDLLNSSLVQTVAHNNE